MVGRLPYTTDDVDCIHQSQVEVLSERPPVMTRTEWSLSANSLEENLVWLQQPKEIIILFEKLSFVFFTQGIWTGQKSIIFITGTFLFIFQTFNLIIPNFFSFFL